MGMNEKQLAVFIGDDLRVYVKPALVRRDYKKLLSLQLYGSGGCRTQSFHLGSGPGFLGST